VDTTTYQISARTIDTTGNLEFIISTSKSSLNFSGDVRLSSMPTWAADYYPVQLSDGAETRVVAAKYTGIPTFSGTTFVYPTLLFDKTSSYNTSNGRYTLPVSGVYRFNGSYQQNIAGGGAQVLLYKNGVSQGQIDRTSDTASVSGSNYDTLVEGVVGDYIEIRTDATTACSGWGNFCVQRISGPATIAASEKVEAKYRSTSGTSIPNSGTQTILDFNNKIFDSHNAVTTGASWRFTAPSNGKYNIDVHFWFANGTWTTGNYLRYAIFKNGSADDNLGQVVIQNTFTNNFGQTGSTSVELKKDEYIDLRLDHNRSGGALSIYASESGIYSSISIIKE
jgi:hypothetical protein